MNFPKGWSPFVNGPIIGTIMKETVRRAIAVIRARRFDFEVKAKGFRSDGKTDWVTTADPEARTVYVKLLKECFPDFGIIAEEENLTMPCRLGIDAYFTVDPLDCTSAFKRKQYHGVGTMLCLVISGEIVAVCIGDVLTGELYFFRPDSHKTHRISAEGAAVPLLIDPTVALAKQYLLLSDPPERISPLVDQLAHSDLFENYEVTGGSIGISTARLWKGEVGGVITCARRQTPWDVSPVIGISKRLGCHSFRLYESMISEFQLLPVRETYEKADPILTIHSSRIIELEAWVLKNNVALRLLHTPGE